MARSMRFVRPAAGMVAAAPVFAWDRRNNPVRAEEFNATTFTPLKCVRNQQLTHNVRKITLALPNDQSTPSWTTKVPIANVLVAASFPDANTQETKQLAKPYNPIEIDEPGSLTLVVKRYADARLGGALHALQPGDSVLVKEGCKQWAFEAGKYKRYGIVAGGTGITPLFQALQVLLENESKDVVVTFVCVNKTREDMLLKDELQSLKSRFGHRLLLKEHIDSENGGQLTEERIKALLPPPAEGTLIMCCGPAAMTKAVAGPKARDFSQGEVGGFLKALGFSKEQVFKV